tara:strand:- start:2347 stop:3039 length:693 start_codon:yes stop_codon:yes gene_type:complete
MNKHIIAIGGGGFGRSIGDLKVEKYITSLSLSSKPNICFVPTASGDNDAYKVSFYSVFTRLGCNPSHIDFFKRTVDLTNHIDNQDIIFVGGGNTKSMLAIWKDWGLDAILKNAYEKGVIMSGVSAGAICWFEKGITDSWSRDLEVIDCMGFVKGRCCPHYDEEVVRKPYVEKLLEAGSIENCYALEGGSALHFKDGMPFKSISFGDNKKSYLISTSKSAYKEENYAQLNL